MKILIQISRQQGTRIQYHGLYQQNNKIKVIALQKRYDIEWPRPFNVKESIKVTLIPTTVTKLIDKNTYTKTKFPNNIIANCR